MLLPPTLRDGATFDCRKAHESRKRRSRLGHGDVGRLENSGGDVVEGGGGLEAAVSTGLVGVVRVGEAGVGEGEADGGGGWVGGTQVPAALPPAPSKLPAPVVDLGRECSLQISALPPPRHNSPPSTLKGHHPSSQ